MSLPLRPYQEEAVLGINLAWENGARSTLLVLPTGCGKTRVFAEVLLRRKGGRKLVLAHRDELIEQAANAIRRDVGVEPEVEQADRYAQTYGWAQSPIVVASVQTLHSRRRQRWPSDSFDTIVIDEAHHATAASYRAILDHFPAAKVLGVTATPDRGDETGLRNVFDSVAYTYEIRQAIADGYLCPIRQIRVQCDDIDLSQVRSVRGDLSDRDVQQAMDIDAVHHQIAGPLAREAGDRPTIVFVPGVDFAKHLAQVMSAYTTKGVSSVDGETPKEERRDTLRRFRAGELQYLVNVGVLTEGFDAPLTQCIAVARPTKSRALYAQMIGRGTRIAEGKADCLVIDFAGNAGKHSLVSALDVLAGKDIPDEVRKRANKKIAEGQETMKAIEEAEREAEEHQRKLEEEKRRRHVLAEAKYKKATVDPFVILGLASKPAFTNGGAPLTATQRGHLEKYGVKTGDVSAAAANAMLDSLQNRRRKGLCTYKQAACLARNGANPDLGYAEARDALDELALSGWRATPEWRARWGLRKTA